jgi:hypothetical protein
LGNVGDLPQELRGIDFDETTAFLIAVAVAITRSLDLPARHMPGGRAAESIAGLMLIDALCVTLMFNIVTRIANAYDLEPEWIGVRRGAGLQRVTRALMALGVRWQMPLREDDNEPTEVGLTQVESQIRQFGLDPTSSLWRHLDALPTIEVAIAQLLSAAAHGSLAEQQSVDETPRDCLQHVGASVKLERADRGLSVWNRLDAEPEKVTHATIAALELDASIEIDMVFRVALLAALKKLNRADVSELVEQAFTA